MTYIPGEAYQKGYAARMGGAERPSNLNDSVSVYWEEWGTGWNDANTYIYMAFAQNPFVTSGGIPNTAR